MKKQSTEKRFWSGVDIPDKPDACWNWQRGKNAGYGLITYQNNKWRAHRLSYTFAYGAIPAGMWILHHCDNRSCVNPSHLYPGGAIQNARDAVERNGIKRGENSPNAKLTQEDVDTIRSMYASGGCIQKELAAHYEVCHQYINTIITLKARYRKVEVREVPDK